jgi:hypothetical protein
MGLSDEEKQNRKEKKPETKTALNLAHFTPGQGDWPLMATAQLPFL